jgi:CRISPR-associated endonuclease/helicase Cas3
MLHQRPITAYLRRQADLEPLAKSGIDPADTSAFRRARAWAGYPDSMRHEALSARIVDRLLAIPSAAGGYDVDRELVVHLIAAHHGRSRPLLPAVLDPDPRPVSAPAVAGTVEVYSGDTVDWEEPVRMAALTEQYGPWGLALLETVVRLADIWCSEHDEETDQ